MMKLGHSTRKAFLNVTFLPVAPSATYDRIKKNRCSILVIGTCRSYICLGREKVIHSKKREKIKVRHDEKKCFFANHKH
jgi:hypothetical protein